MVVSVSHAVRKDLTLSTQTQIMSVKRAIRCAQVVVDPNLLNVLRAMESEVWTEYARLVAHQMHGFLTVLATRAILSAKDRAWARERINAT